MILNPGISWYNRLLSIHVEFGDRIIAGVALYIYLKIKSCTCKILSCCKAMVISSVNGAEAGSSPRDDAVRPRDPECAQPLQTMTKEEVPVDSVEQPSLKPLVLRHGKWLCRQEEVPEDVIRCDFWWDAAVQVLITTVRKQTEAAGGQIWFLSFLCKFNVNKLSQRR